MTDKRLHYLIVVCFHALVVTVPLYFRFTTEELFEFNKLLLVYVFTALITGLWISRMIMRGSLSWKRSAFDIPLVLFLASQLLSTIFSIHPRTSWLGYYTRFHGGLLSYLAYSLLYSAAVHNLGKKHIKPLLLSAVVSASVVSIYGVLEHFGHSPSCLIITNGASSDVSCWIQDVQSRVFATFGQPNWLAAYAITLWPIAAWLSVQRSQKLLVRLVSFTAWLLLTVVLLYTKSRSGFLGLMAGVAVLIGLYVVTYWWKQRKNPDHKVPLLSQLLLPWLAAGVAVLLIIGIVSGTPFTPSVGSLQVKTETAADNTEQIEPIVAVDRLAAGGTDSGEIRKIVWTGALAVWQRYPLLGSGVETFAYSYYRDRPTAHNLVSEWDFLYNKAHNEVLNFLATTGTVGGFAYLLLVSWIGVITWRLLITQQLTANEQQLAAALTAGVAAQFVSNFFGFSTVVITLLWFLYMAFVAILESTALYETVPTKAASKNETATMNSKKSRTATLQSQESSTAIQWFGLSLTWFAVLISVVLVYRMYAADTAYARGKALLAAGDFAAGNQSLQAAISLAPREALYYDELAHQFAKIAVEVASAQNATSASQLANTAVVASDTALSLNPVHLNFYKTRARMFITLAQLKPELLLNAKEAFEAALERAPTDAKLLYNLALVEMGLDNQAASIQLLEKTVMLKSNYGAARLELAKAYLATNQPTKAETQLMYILENISPGDVQTLQMLEQVATTSATTTHP